jgi:hypothetical protein
MEHTEYRVENKTMEGYMNDYEQRVGDYIADIHAKKPRMWYDRGYEDDKGVWDYVHEATRNLARMLYNTDAIDFWPTFVLGLACGDDKKTSIWHAESCEDIGRMAMAIALEAKAKHGDNVTDYLFYRNIGVVAFMLAKAWWALVPDRDDDGEPLYFPPLALSLARGAMAYIRRMEFASP